MLRLRIGVGGVSAAFLSPLLLVLVACPKGAAGDRQLQARRPLQECASSGSLVADSLVRREDIQTALHRRAFPDAQSELLQDGSGQGLRFLVALSWHGPNSGAVILLSCKGAILAEQQTGFIDSVKGGQLPGLGGRIAITYMSSGGSTSETSATLSLFSIAHDSISLLWTGSTFQGDYSNPSSGLEERATVQIDSSGAISRDVTQVRVRYDEKANIWVQLPNTLRHWKERFLWDPLKGFVRVR